MNRATLLLLALAAPTASAQPFPILRLGVLPGASSSEPVAASVDGNVVVGNSGSAGFRWTAATGLTSLGAPPAGFEGVDVASASASGAVLCGTARSATGNQTAVWSGSWSVHSAGLNSSCAHVSADGSALIGVESPGATQVFLYRAAVGGGRVRLQMPAGISGNGAVLRGLSASGAVAVGHGSQLVNGSFEDRPLRWDGTAPTVLPLPAGGIGRALAVSANGTTAVGFFRIPGPGSVSQAVRWTSSGREGLGPNTGPATHVSADGSVVAGIVPNAAGFNELFWWTAATGAVRPALPAGWRSAVAAGLSADGRAVVGLAETSGGDRLYLWTPAGGFVDLVGRVFSARVNGLSADGSTLFGTIGSATPQAFIVRLPPPLALFGPAAGALVVAGEPLRIRWNAPASVDFVDLVLLPDTLGAAPVTLDFALPAADTAYVWAVPETLFSRSARLVLRSTTDPAVADTSAAFRVRPLHLVRLQPDGRYEPFNPQRHGWAFGNNSTALFPAPWFAQPRFQYDNDGGLDPVTGDAYSFRFRFITGAAPPAFVDWPSWVGAFGRDATYSGAGSFVFYRLNALQQWAARTDPSWEGSCFGMTVTSLMAFTDPARFGAAFPTIGAVESVFALGADLDAQPDIRAAVNNRFAYQYGRVSQQRMAQARSQTPRETLAELKVLFADDAHPGLATLALFAAEGGHSVLAYALGRTGTPGRYRVEVYDPNHPGGLTGTPVVIDSTTNRWSLLDLGWDERDGLYLEDPIGNYYGAAVHPDLGPALGGDPLAVHVTPGTRVTLTDPAGRRIGYADGSTFNEVPGAYPDVPRVGGPTPPVGFYVPAGVRYRLALSDAPGGAVRAVFDGGARLLAFARTGTAAGQTDALTLEPDGLLRVRNPDAAPRAVTLSALDVSPEEERWLALDGLTLGGPDSLRFRPEGGGTARVENPGAAKAYTLRLFRAGDAGDATFEAAAPPLAAGATHRLRPAWAGLATVALDVDANGDGTFEQTITLVNTVAGEAGPAAGAPAALALYAPRPNPTSGAAAVPFDLPAPGRVRLSVYDLLGREVAVLVQGALAAGRHEAEIDGGRLAPGVYVVRLTAGTFAATQRLVVVR